MQRLEPEFSQFVRHVENRFGLHIPSADAERLVTPGAVVAYLLGRVGALPGDTCRSRHFFYALRRALVFQLGIPRAEVRPQARLDRFLPRGKRRRAWEYLRTGAGAQWWPELRREGWLERTVWYGGITSGSAALVGGIAAGLSGGAAVLLGLAAAPAAGVALGRLGRPAEVAVPVGYERVADLVRLLVAEASPAPGEARAWSHEQVTATVGEILAREFQVRQWLPDARFHEDFGFE